MRSAAEPTRIPIVLKDADAEATAVVERAMREARAAQLRWGRTPLEGRLKLIRKLRRLIAEHAVQLAYRKL